MSTQVQIPNLEVLKKIYLGSNTISSYEVQKREDSFLIMITQRRARLKNYKSLGLISSDLGGMTNAVSVAQAGGLRIKFAVYADLE